MNTAHTASLLHVQDLHVHYGKSHILHGVTFEVGKGEVISLLGRNGSGRSTALKAVMGLVTPTAGHVRLTAVTCPARVLTRCAARASATCRRSARSSPTSRWTRTCEWANSRDARTRLHGPAIKCSTIFRC